MSLIKLRTGRDLIVSCKFCPFAALATFCQVYPSEYAYLNGSVDVQEEPSVNCRRYPHGLGQGILLTENYLHCNGTQLKLADSDLGPERYTNSDYYVWPTGAVSNQLLFIFPTRVTLSSITLHYYSDSDRGLPRLRFFAVPDDFNIWEAPSASYSYVEVAAVPPGGDPAGRRRVNVKCYLNTLRVLMINSGSTVHFAVSEVEFFTCAGKHAHAHLPQITYLHFKLVKFFTNYLVHC